MVTWRDSVNYKSSVCDPHKVTDSEGKICEPENIARNVIKTTTTRGWGKKEGGALQTGGGPSLAISHMGKRTVAAEKLLGEKWLKIFLM